MTLKKQKILITGGAGFIASNIADLYIEEGHEVVIVDNLSTGERTNIPKKAVFYQEDICNLEKLEAIFKKEKPSLVNHHAAQIDVRTSISNPQKDAQINIIGAINLLELARKYAVSKLIYAGTGGALYGELKNSVVENAGDSRAGCEGPLFGETHPKRLAGPAFSTTSFKGELPDETSSVNPLSHYGVSKYCGEHYFRLYAVLYNLNVTIFRYANIYGPRQNPMGEAGVIAIFINRLLSGKIPTIFGEGEQARDFTYVGDVARANLMALDKGTGTTINIGTGEMTTINKLFEILKKETGFKGDVKHAPGRMGEIIKSGLDVTSSKKILGWSANISLAEGLKKTIAWQQRQC